MSSAATGAKPPKRRASSQRKKSGPTVSDLILKVLSGYTERGGMSLAAVKKGLQAGGYDVGKNNARVLLAIRRLVALKTLVQTKGTGASGSFKLNKKAPALLKKKVVSKRKPKTKRAKRATVKKAAGGDMPAAKKSPKKKRKAKSPRKAKKPSAAKTAKKPKSPMKRRVVKSTRTRAAGKK